MNREISDEMLNAFADNELDGAEKSALLDRIAVDPQLRAKVCEVWHLKELVRSAHPLPIVSAHPTHPSRSWRMFGLPLAACLLMALGATSGWLAHDEYERSWISTPQMEAIRAHGNRVVLHLVSDDSVQVEKALHKAEQLVSAQDGIGGAIQVELIANGTGIHLLQAGTSPIAKRVLAMHRTHANLRLIACNEAIERLREQGEQVTLLPEVDVVSSAVAQIAARVGQGWKYLQV